MWGAISAKIQFFSPEVLPDDKIKSICNRKSMFLKSCFIIGLKQLLICKVTLAALPQKKWAKGHRNRHMHSWFSRNNIYKQVC